MTVRKLLVAGCVTAILASFVPTGRAEDPLRQPVLNSIDLARRFLLRQQRADGSWSSDRGNYAVGIHSLVLLALVNTGMTAQDPPIQKALEWLRENDKIGRAHV